MTKKNAFTLAEILIVLVIIGVLTMILLPMAFQSSPDEEVIKFKKDMLPSVKTLLGQQLATMGATPDSEGNYSVPVKQGLTLNVVFKDDYLCVSNAAIPEKTFASSSNAGKFSGKTGVIYVDMPKGSIMASAATMAAGVDLSGYFYAWSDDEQSEAVLHIDDNPESNILKLIIKTVDGMK